MAVLNWTAIGRAWLLLGRGKERGIFFTPEVDDEVLVAFEQGRCQLSLRGWGVME